MTVCAWAVTAPACAAGDGEKVGENIGNLLGGWAKSLYVGIAAVVALMFLLNRRFADLAVFMVAALLVGGFVMAPERHRRHDPRHLADDHGLMADRVVIRSYRRVFEVDRRIYRVDRWALPVPGGVPLRAVGYFAATLLAVLRWRAAAAASSSRCCRRRCASWSCRWRSRCSARRRRRTAAPRIASRGTGCGSGCARGGARRAVWCALEGEPVRWDGELAVRWDADGAAAASRRACAGRRG